MFVGQSGVGKSSLVNSLLPEVNLRVGPLSELSGQGTPGRQRFVCGFNGTTVSTALTRRALLKTVTAAPVLLQLLLTKNV